VAYPYIFHANFEAGSAAEWDSETDDNSLLDFPHYSTLAALPYRATPFSGAYCARLVLGTSDAVLTEADCNIVDTATSYFHFNLFFSSEFDATENDTFALLELKGAAAAVTVSIGARYVAATDAINLGAGGAPAAAVPVSFSTISLDRNIWYTVEAEVNIETNGTGTTSLYITKEGDPAQLTADVAVTSSTHIAVTDAVFGIQDQLATTTGTILLDNFIQDDARIYPKTKRWSREVLLEKSGHVLVGNGVLETVTLLAGGAADNVLRIFDTDEANTTDVNNVVLELKNGTASETVERADSVVRVTRGAYVDLAGTNPRARVTIRHGGGFGSDAVMRDYGRKRTGGGR
jgi:hypothetical protein